MTELDLLTDEESMICHRVETAVDTPQLAKSQDPEFLRRVIGERKAREKKDISLLVASLIAARAEIAAFREAARHSAKRHAELDGISDELILCRADLQAARAENERLHAENKRKDDLLRRLEWSGGYWDSVSDTMLSTCPVCSAPENHGMVHSDGCELSALLQSEKEGE